MTLGVADNPLGEDIWVDVYEQPSLMQRVADNGGCFVLPGGDMSLLDELSLSTLQLNHYGRTYQFLGEGGNRVALVNDGTTYPGQFILNMQGSDVFFVPDVSSNETSSLSIDIAERSFYADPQLSAAEQAFFLSGEFQEPGAIIFTETFNSAATQEITIQVYTGELPIDEYLELFQAAVGITYNERIQRTIKRRILTVMEWVSNGHEIRRPLFAKRDSFESYEESALSEAERIHHATNKGFKYIDFKSIPFDECIQRASDYMFGVLDFSRARIRDFIGAITDCFIEFAQSGEADPRKMGLLISPSFQCVAGELKHLFGDRIDIRRTNLEQTALSQHLPGAAENYPPNPLRVIRTESLLGHPEEERIQLMLAREVLYEVIRRLPGHFETTTSLDKIEVDYRASLAVN